MPIKNVQIATKTIPFKNADESEGSIEVRGITVADIMQAAHKYGTELVLVFGKLKTDGSESLQDKDVRRLIWEVSTELPDLLAAVLAMAADEYNDDGVEIMRKLPIDSQAEVLTAVFSLSFASEGSLEKLAALMMEWMAQVRLVMDTAMGRTSTTGIGDSGAA